MFPPADGVEGVSGKEPSREEGDPRRVALLIGRNIPAPGIAVAKYVTLYDLSVHKALRV